MEKLKTFFAENPHYFGLVIVVFGVVMLLSAIYDAKWVFGDVSRATCDLRKIDGWVNFFGRKTARIMVGVMSVVSILAGIVWFVLYAFGHGCLYLT